MVLIALGEPQREIAGRLGVTEGRVCQLAQRARQRIAQAAIAA